MGALVTVGFAMIFGPRSTTLHLIMTGSLSAVSGVLLFVSIAIDHPFAGDVAVSPAPAGARDQRFPERAVIHDDEPRTAS